MGNIQSQWMSLEEATTQLGISRQALQAATRGNDITPRKIKAIYNSKGEMVYYRPDVDAYRVRKKYQKEKVK